MKVAWLYLRHTNDKRYHIFSNGLKKLGFQIKHGLPTSCSGQEDLFVTWNRLSASNSVANEFISKGEKVLVAENAIWLNEFSEKNGSILLEKVEA